jgi:hypothetical protein
VTELEVPPLTVAEPDETAPFAPTDTEQVICIGAPPEAAGGALTAGGTHPHVDAVLPAAATEVNGADDAVDEPLDELGGAGATQEIGGSHAGGTGEADARSLELTAFPPPSAATTFPAGAPVERSVAKVAGRRTARATQPVAVGVSSSEPYAVVSMTFAVGADVRATATRIGWGCPAPTICVVTIWRAPEEAGCHSGLPVCPATWSSDTSATTNDAGRHAGTGGGAQVWPVAQAILGPPMSCWYSLTRVPSEASRTSSCVDGGAYIVPIGAYPPTATPAPCDDADDAVGAVPPCPAAVG